MSTTQLELCLRCVANGNDGVSMPWGRTEDEAFSRVETALKSIPSLESALALKDAALAKAVEALELRRNMHPGPDDCDCVYCAALAACREALGGERP